MKNRICQYCGSKIAFGDYCCPGCGAVPPGDDYFTNGITGKTSGFKKSNTPTDRAERLKNNKRMNAAAALSTVMVVVVASSFIIPKIDFKKLRKDNSEKKDFYTEHSIDFDIDTSSIVYNGMKDWKEEYGSLFQNEFSVPDFDVNEFFAIHELSSYSAEQCTYNSEDGIIANSYFLLEADKDTWSMNGEKSGDSVSISSDKAEVTVTCLHNSSGMNKFSAEEAAQLGYENLSKRDVLVNEPFEYKSGDVTGHAVTWVEFDSEDVNTRLYLSNGNDTILLITLVGNNLYLNEDADNTEGKEEIDKLISSVELYDGAGAVINNLYTDETIVSKGNGAYQSTSVSFEVSDDWKEEKCESGRLFSLNGVSLGIEVKNFNGQNKNFRLSSYEAADYYSSELRKVSDDIDVEYEDLGNHTCYSLTQKYAGENETHRRKYYFFTEGDTLVILSFDGTYEQLDETYDKVAQVIASVKILSDDEKPGGTMQGVNLKNYAVPAEYDTDHYVRSDFASMWVDPDFWTLSKEASDTGQMSFVYDKGDATLFLTFSQSDLIKKYTPYQLAEYYSKNLGKNAEYEFVSLENGKLGEYESGDLHMKCFKDDPVELYMKIVKKDDKAFMVYRMTSEGRIAEAEENIEKMLATFKFE